MAESLTTKTVEGATGVTFALPFHDDASSRFYPLVQLVPTELGGLTTYRLLSAATVNATIVKTTAGQLYGLDLSSIDIGAVFLKIYDKATTPSETDTPKMTFALKAGSSTAVERIEKNWTHGIPFTAGIGFRITTGIADNDTAAVDANEHIIQLYYK